jgi:tetratricopeptide (TPR) repeat protein
MNRGIAYLALGQTDKAIADFTKVVELNLEPELVKQAQEQLDKLNASQ